MGVPGLSRAQSWQREYLKQNKHRTAKDAKEAWKAKVKADQVAKKKAALAKRAAQEHDKAERKNRAALKKAAKQEAQKRKQAEIEKKKKRMQSQGAYNRYRESVRRYG